MDPQFSELSKQIAEDVSVSVTASITEAVTASVTEAVNRHVSEVVTAAEKRLANEFAGAERRLSDQARVNTEAVREEAKAAADGYAATLDAINRRLDRIEISLTERLDDHDVVLKNHNQRISALEQ